MPKFNITGLKTLEEFIKSNSKLDNNRNVNAVMNRALKGKIIYEPTDERFYRISRDTSSYSDRICYVYYIGNQYNMERFLSKTPEEISVLKSTTGMLSISLYYNKVYIVNEFNMSKKEQIVAKVIAIETKIKEKQIELNFEKGKIKFMNENNLDEFDENQYKVYNALATLQSGATLFEKSKVIAEIITQK